VHELDCITSKKAAFPISCSILAR